VQVIKTETTICLVIDKSSNSLCFEKVGVNHTKLSKMSVSLLVMPGQVSKKTSDITSALGQWVTSTNKANISTVKKIKKKRKINYYNTGHNNYTPKLPVEENVNIMPIQNERCAKHIWLLLTDISVPIVCIWWLLEKHIFRPTVIPEAHPAVSKH